MKAYTSHKSSVLKKNKKFSERMESCDTENMFHNMIENAEEKDKNQNMPVRMFYRNTFGDIINTAMFELKKK